MAEQEGHRPSEAEAAQPQHDTGLLCLVLMARFFEQPVDPEKLRHAHGRTGQPFDETDILESARSLNFKVWAVTSKLKRLTKTPLPALALVTDDVTDATGSPAGAWVILGKEGRERRGLDG